MSTDICRNKIHASVNHASTTTCNVVPGTTHSSWEEARGRRTGGGGDDEGEHGAEVRGVRVGQSKEGLRTIKGCSSKREGGEHTVGGGGTRQGERGGSASELERGRGA